MDWKINEWKNAWKTNVNLPQFPQLLQFSLVAANVHADSRYQMIKFCLNIIASQKCGQFLWRCDVWADVVKKNIFLWPKFQYCLWAVRECFSCVCMISHADDLPVSNVSMWIVLNGVMIVTVVEHTARTIFLVASQRFPRISSTKACHHCYVVAPRCECAVVCERSMVSLFLGKR